MSILLLLVLLGGRSVGAQGSTIHTDKNDGDGDDEPSVYLALQIDDDNSTTAHLTFETSLAQKYNFPKIFSRILGCPIAAAGTSRTEENDFSTIDTPCEVPFDRSIVGRTRTFDLQSITSIQRADPDVTFAISFLFPKNKFVRCEPVSEQIYGTMPFGQCLYEGRDALHTPATIRFDVGGARIYALRTGSILGFLLLIPIMLTFWFRRRAVMAPDDAKPAVSFAYRRFLTWTGLLGILVWWASVDLLRADDFVSFILNVRSWSDSVVAEIFPWVPLWMAPASVYFICLALSGPMQSLRGIKLTRGQILKRSFWAVGRFMIPLPMVCTGIAEMFESPRIGVPLVAAGLITLRLANAKFARAYGMELHALTSGELRDRAFALAQMAKARLNQLYVLPMESMRMANAFAHSAHNVYLTDYLVKYLSKDEVDAVVAHEITHLQKRHIGRRIIILIGLVLGVILGETYFERWIPANFPKGPIFYGVALLGLFFVSRRNEFAADAGAVKLTGNAEAMITALARITRLNTMPLQWSKLDEKLLTHPSTLRRINRLARNAGISKSRTAELLLQSSALPLETYSIPATALLAGKIFSTRYKIRVSWKVGWAIALTSVLLPAVVASIVQSVHLGTSARWLAYLLGLILTIVADLTLLNLLPMIGVAKLERQLREKCREQSNNSLRCDGIFVGLAPDARPRIYEANWNWDLGFLSLGPDHLSYWGEEAQFRLRRDQITSIKTGPGPAGWFAVPSIYFSWRDSADSENTFNLRAMHARSMRDLAVKTHLLMHDLENWIGREPASSNTLPATPEPLDETAGPPAFGQVTGMSPKMTVRGRVLVRDFMFNTFVVILVVLFFGLRFAPLERPSPCAGPQDISAGFGGLYVLFAVWLTRALVFTPYWRARE